jgi:LacI family transcriptional regulator
MITLQDVARHAGVAPITVSRVINHSGYVTETVRERVEKSIAELGYVPNTLARSLRSRRTQTIALVITDITNPFFTTVARGVEDTASDSGYMVIICNTDERKQEEQKYMRMLLQRRVDGILLVPTRSGAESIKLAKKQQVSLVVLDRRVSGAVSDVVRCDSESGAYQLANLLVSLGHRRIVILAGAEGISTSDDRVQGFCRALSDAEIDSELQIFHGEFTQESGHQLTLKALSQKPAPTAIFAANNFLAMGSFRAIEEAGLRVPEDIALVGFDDLPPALVISPFLTVASQPAYEMGCRSVQLLLSRIEGKAPEEYQEVVLPTELIIRHSSGEALR